MERVGVDVGVDVDLDVDLDGDVHVEVGATVDGGRSPLLGIATVASGSAPTVASNQIADLLVDVQVNVHAEANDDVQAPG